MRTEIRFENYSATLASYCFVFEKKKQQEISSYQQHVIWNPT